MRSRAGTYYGHVCVWDVTRRDDPQQRLSGSELSHREPVSCVRWVWQEAAPAHAAAADDARWRIVSLSLDGQILVWAYQKLEAPLAPGRVPPSPTAPHPLQPRGPARGVFNRALRASEHTMDRQRVDQLHVPCSSGSALGQEDTSAPSAGLRPC